MGTIAELLATRPTDAQVMAAAAQCVRANTPPVGIIGLSDPNALDTRVIDLCADAGAEMVRVEFHWSQIQPVPGGPYQWAPYDAMVGKCIERGLGILGIATYLPNWLGTNWAVIDAQWQLFFQALVARYAPFGVHMWEVFNEPNLTGYGWLPKTSDVPEIHAEDYAGAYTLLLARANVILRATDPQGMIVLGGLASDNHGGVPFEPYMTEVYRLGGRNCFDVFAFHPYGYQNNFAAARARVDAFLSTVSDTPPVWFNEYGWTDWRRMNMNRYPTAATNPMMAVFRDRVHCDALFWFSLKDYSSKWLAPTFGLCDYNLKKRPGFTTFKTLAGTA